jgi:hypothetical protein
MVGGGDEALGTLLRGIVELEDGWVRLLLFKIDAIDKFAKHPDIKPKRPPQSRADGQREFLKWRQDCQPNIPSLQEDYEHMRKFGVSRDTVIKLRESAQKLKRGRPPVKNGRGKSPKK